MLCAKLCVVVQVEKRLHVDEDILARAGIFQGMDAASISALLKDLVPETFRKGDTIIREGEPGDKLYIIVEGKLKLSRTALMVAKTSLLFSAPPTCLANFLFSIRHRAHHLLSV